MKKILYVVVFVLFSTFILTSCASNKSINIAKDYLEEYYNNFSQKKSLQCYYQLNKNSDDILKEKYNIATEDFLSARSRILGPVISYEIINDAYFKEEQDKYVDFEVLVKYKNVELNEKYQIIIKNDGQTSINILEFDEDSIIEMLISSYKSAFEANDIEKVKEIISSIYYLNKTEKNLENIINQAEMLGGKLLGVEIVEENYIFEPFDNSAYVYEVLIELSYENDTMQNKIKIAEDNGELGIGSIVILPEKILSFIEKYSTHIKEDDKDNTINLYEQEIFAGSQDSKDTKWKLLKSYEEAYGKLINYDVLAYGYDNVKEPNGAEYEAMRVDVTFNYEQASVKHKLTLIEDGDGYLIKNQTILDE